MDASSPLPPLHAASRRSGRDPVERIAPYALSPELEALALQIARLTRLSRRLRADVAEEAAAEIRALLDARIPPSDIPARLGHPAEVAARLRRERLAQRLVIFRVLSGWKTALLFAAIFVVLLYSGLLVWFHTARPTISRNFSAELNARIDALPGERAAPVYLAAIAAMPDLPEELMNAGLSGINPGDAAWPSAQAYLKSMEAPLAEVRRAAGMPVFGMHLGDAMIPGWSLSKEGRAISPSAGSENPTMIGVMLPHLGVMRGLARILAGDALDAAEQHDSTRAAADLTTMLGMAHHSGEPPFLICDLVEIAINQLAIARLERLIERYPGLFSDAQLAALAQSLADCRVGGDAIHFDGERTFIEDMVQRVFTDNGNGDGRVCAAGLRTWHEYSGAAGGPGGSGLSVEEWVFGPVIAYTTATRREFLSTYNAIMDETDRVKSQPRYASSGVGRLDARIAAMNTDVASSQRFTMLAQLLPAFGKAVQSGQDMTEARDGALVVVALERFRLASGRFPDSLEDLVPKYLATIPPDPFDGKPMRYHLTAGKPVLYTVGPDLDDDGGRPPAGPNGNESARRWLGKANAASAPDGDHILWPEPAAVPLPTANPK